MSETITEAPETEAAVQPADEAAAAPAPPESPTSAPPVVPQALRVMMGRYTGPRDLDGQLRLSAQLATAKSMLPRRYRDNPGDVLALVQHAIALDIELAVALSHVHVNEDTGAVGMAAKLMHALVLRAGHRIEVVCADQRLACMRLIRCDGKPGGTAQWTILEAQAAGLPDKQRSPWRSYAADMLWARCISRLTRRYCPDVTLGMYEIGELEDMPSGDDVELVDLNSTVRDADGNLVPAPDVVELLEGLSTLGYEEIRTKWKIASEEGTLRAFAGEVDGVQMTVEDLLTQKGLAAYEREEEARRQQRKLTRQQNGLQDGLLTDNPPPAEPVDLDQVVAEVQVEQAPVGTGQALACGCAPAAVMSAGRHADDCPTRRR